MGRNSDLESRWRLAWLNAADGAETFFNQLQEEFKQAAALNAGGSLMSIGKGSSNQSQAPHGPSTRTTVDNERNALEVLNQYEKLQTALGVDRDEAGELAIYNEGLVYFKASASPDFRTDFSQLRSCPT